jgi:hypothetical protein
MLILGLYAIFADSVTILDGLEYCEGVRVATFSVLIAMLGNGGAVNTQWVLPWKQFETYHVMLNVLAQSGTS